MAMTSEQKKEQVRQIAQWVFRKWNAEGNRFYCYQKHYYLRTGDEAGWLIDFEKCDDIIEEVWNSGGLRHPSTPYKKLLIEELLRLAQPEAILVKTVGLKKSNFADPMLSDTERLESFVNACVERNTL
jgi:hypothetical protein